MKKISTAATPSNKNFTQKLTIGLDLGDRSSWYCVLNEAGEVIGEQKLSTTPKALKEAFAAMPRQPGGSGDGDALALGEPTAKRVGSRSDRGARSQRASDRREPAEG